VEDDELVRGIDVVAIGPQPTEKDRQTRRIVRMMIVRMIMIVMRMGMEKII
jgi:hypothetical protein